MQLLSPASSGVRSGELDPRSISPELVMVDPELARNARTMLNERAEEQNAARQDAPPPAAEEPVNLSPVQTNISRLETELAALRTEVADARMRLIEEPRKERQRQLARMSARASGAFGVFFSAVLFASLLMNLGFIGFLVGGASDGPTLAPSAAPPLTSVVQTTPGLSGALLPLTQPPSSSLATTIPPKSRAEQTIVTRLLFRFRSRLPAILIDRHTGLLKNNVKIICRRSGTPRSFLCVVQPPHAVGGTGLYIRYRPEVRGAGKLTFLGLRR